MSTRKELLTRLAHELAALTQDGKVAAASGKKPVNGSDIRKGYYESGDKIYTLTEAVKSDPNTKGDKALVKAVEDLNKAHTAVYNALKPYDWD